MRELPLFCDTGYYLRMPRRKKSLHSATSHACKGDPPSYTEICLKRLREEGGRISSARLSVVRILEKAERPLVPKEILERAKKASNAASLDLVSVYRNLESLEAKGLVHQIGHNGGYFPCLHSNCGSKIHLLIHCESCEQTQELHIPEGLMGSLKQLITQSNKTISQISTLQIDGICRKCAKRLTIGKSTPTD